MKIALLTNNENQALYQELKREFISDTYEQYLQMIMFDICQELQTDMTTMQNSDFHRELRQVTIMIINKIWLDNLMKYITNSSMSNFVMLIQHGQLGQDIFVNCFYARQVSDVLGKYFNVNAEELDSVTDIVIVRLQYIMACMYNNNSHRYNDVLMTLINNIFQIVRNICFKYYKFELDPYYRPLLFYTERDHSEAFCS